MSLSPPSVAAQHTHTHTHTQANKQANISEYHLFCDTRFDLAASGIGAGCCTIIMGMV
jgi:hypothetical protein